jgi:hypothetical protein
MRIIWEFMARQKDRLLHNQEQTGFIPLVEKEYSQEIEFGRRARMENGMILEEI